MEALQALSVSRPLWAWLSEKAGQARVRAVFERTCLLETPNGDLIALVLSQIGNGPLNIVTEGRPGAFAPLQPGMLAALGTEHLVVGSVTVSIQGAATWEPRPNWTAYRTRSSAIREQLPHLRAVAARLAPETGLLWLTGNGTEAAPPSVTGGEWSDSLSRRVWEGTSAILKGWGGDAAALQAGARRLAGLGVGLTPAGDDLLAGFLLGAWLAHPNPCRLGKLVVEAAHGQTTALSAAFLQAAGSGLCSEPWHDLLAALDSGGHARLEAAVQRVLACGSTSGADTLAGFLLLDPKS